MNKKILLVDDEENIIELLAYNLEKSGYEVLKAMSGEEALDKFRSEKPDLAILDIMLPEIDGLELLRTIRQEADIPTLMLTAKTEEVDRVLGLEMGADDYITKPFSPREVVARVKALFRRTKEKSEEDNDKIIRSSDLLVDTERHRVEINGEAIELTLKEYELLKTLISHAGRVYSREQLLELLWGYDFYGDTRTIDVHIRHLRQKIEKNGGNSDVIETVRGVGYRFKELE